MKASTFDYVRPRTLEEAVALLLAGGGEARVIAGGQSLLPLMNLRLSSPSLLIDIARLGELTSTAEDDDSVTLGAGVTHAMIEDGRVPDPSRGLMPYVAANLAYRAVRNRGTLGGSLALADPAGEWPAVLAALDAEATVRGAAGRRSVKCDVFATAVFETQLAADEIVESLRIPRLLPQARWGYLKLARKTGEFANALAVAVSDPARGYSRVVLGAANGPPLVLAAASGGLAGGSRERDESRRRIAADLDRAGDRGFDEFQRNLLTVAAMRAQQQVIG